MPLFKAVDFEAVAAALGEGATLNQIFKADGSGSGTMVKNTQVIGRHFTVGKSGDVDYTSIKAAVDAAIALGVSGTNPFEIKINAGAYTESPFTVPTGLYVGGVDTRFDSVLITAADPNNDLITMTGGCIAGFRCQGVSDVTKCLIRCATPASLSTVAQVSFRACSNGIIASSGTTCIILTGSALVGGPTELIGTCITATGAGTFVGIAGFFVSAPAALIPFIPVNPIQTFLKVQDSAQVYASTLSATIPYKNTTADIVFAETGGVTFLVGGQFTAGANALHIGSSGSNTEITVQGFSFLLNNVDVNIESGTGKVFANCTADDITYSGTTGSTFVGIIQDRNDKLMNLRGDVNYLFEGEVAVRLSEYFSKFVSTCVTEGGEVTAATGLNVDVAAGKGFVRRGTPDFNAESVSWIAVEDLALTASSTNYVFYDAGSVAIEASTSPPGYGDKILLATIVTDGSGIRFLHKTRVAVSGYIEQVREYLLSTRKRALNSGLGVVEGSTNLKIDVGNGSYYIAMDLISYAGADDAGFSYFYGTNGATEVSGQTALDDVYYDNAGTLTAMTTDYYKADTVILSSDGRVSIIYGTAEYSSQTAAEESVAGNTPTFIEPTSCPLAKIITKKSNGIQSIIDIRPSPDAAAGGGGGGVSVHAALSGLSADDHTQYLLVSGTRAMSGALNLSSNNITNAGTINSVNISAHASRHQPGGADAIALATPTGVLVGATAAEGSNASLARSDHQHGIATGTPSTIGTANAAGSSSSAPRLDHVHAHGDLTGGSLHADVTTSVDGFMIASDKTKLDGIASGATNSPLSSTAPVNVTKAAASAGVATDASRQDHKHDVTTAAPITGAVAIGNSVGEGTATTLARSDHAHAVAAGTPVSVSTANNVGSATTFARSDHVHSGLTRGAGDFDTFTAKSSPAANDIMLMEDSAAANVKKKVLVSNLQSYIAPNFGKEFYSAASEGESTTASATYVEKLNLTTGTLEGGTYRIEWYAELAIDSTNIDMLMRVQIDNTTTVCEPNLEEKDTTNYLPFSGFYVTSLTAAVHTIDLDFRVESVGPTVAIRRARLTLFRVS